MYSVYIYKMKWFTFSLQWITKFCWLNNILWVTLFFAPPVNLSFNPLISMWQQETLEGNLLPIDYDLGITPLFAKKYAAMRTGSLSHTFQILFERYFYIHWVLWVYFAKLFCYPLPSVYPNILNFKSRAWWMQGENPGQEINQQKFGYLS